MAACGILYGILYQSIVYRDFKPLSLNIDLGNLESSKFLGEGWQTISRKEQPGHVYSQGKESNLNIQLPEETNWTLRLKLQFAKSGQKIKVYANKIFIGEGRSYEGKGIGRWYFTLPKEVAVQGLNKIRIENSDPSSKILYEGISLKNYRGALESKGAFILFDSPRHIKFGKLLLAMLIGGALIILIDTGMTKILGVIGEGIFKKDFLLTYVPFLSFLFLLYIGSLVSPYQIIISKGYFWVGLILFYILGRLILIALYISKAKETLPLYLRPEYIRAHLVNWLVCAFILLIALCAVLIICKEKKAANYVAIAAYLLLSCGIVVRLFELKKAS